MERNVRKRSSICSRNGSTCPEGLVEKLPVEVIQEILSRVEVARDVIRASVTCGKWLHAYRKLLHTLSFDGADDKRVYRQLPASGLEMLVATTLFQPLGLRKLTVLLDDMHEFSAVAAAGWLMFTRETSSELFCKVGTSPSIDVLGVCGRWNLETLSLCFYTITGVEPVFRRFPCLTSLSLKRVRISAEHLNRLLLALPRIEHLELTKIVLGVVVDDDYQEQVTSILHRTTLKSLFLKDLEEFEFTLENGGIEYLHVEDCIFCSFKVVGSKSLRQFKISNSEFRLLKIDEGDDLEGLAITSSHITGSNLFPMKVRAPKLKMFRIWRFTESSVSFQREGEIIVDESGLIVDLEQMGVCLPQLSHLSLFFDEGAEGVDYRFRGLSSLENVAILDIGWDHFRCDCFEGFTEWTEKVLTCCPNVRQLIVHGVVPDRNNAKYLKDLAEHTSSMSEMMRRYPLIEVKFAYIYPTESRTYFLEHTGDCAGREGGAAAAALSMPFCYCEKFPVG